MQRAFGSKLSFNSSYHPESDGQTERVNQILEDMLRACVMDFQGNWDQYLPLVEFSYKNSYQATIQMAPFEALYGRKCRTPLCWDELEEALIVGLDLIQEMTDKVKMIQQHIRTAQSRQKSYAYKRRKPLEFQIGDRVFLKISPTKGVRRFNVKGKLSSRYIGPYPMVGKVNPPAYRLELPSNLGHIHDVFYISQLWKYVPDPMYVLKEEPPLLAKDLTFEQQLIQILDRRIKRLRTKEVPLVKVLWANQETSEATWETEDEMMKNYPHLF